MKSCILPLALFVCTCGLLSCSKDPGSDLQDLPAGSLIPANNKTIVSSWFTLPLAQTEQSESFCLTGQVNCTQVAEGFSFYDKERYVALAYVKVPAAEPGEGIHFLPWNRPYPDEHSSGNLTMNYDMDQEDFTVSVRANGDGIDHPGPVLFGGLVYRFLVIPRSVYLVNNSINWTNYDEVAHALNLQ